MKMELNTAEVLAAFDTAPGQVAYATMLALNRTADTIKAELQWEMNRVFDKPTPWFLNSIRPSYATKTKLVSEIGYYWKAKDRSENGDASRSMVEPHVYGGSRHYKAMEVRLFKSGLLPEGWNVVPGGAANLDAFGNMSQGQITQILNVLQTYTEAGYNTANSKTIAKLEKGNKKKGTYGFTYWVNPPPHQSTRQRQALATRRVSARLQRIWHITQTSADLREACSVQSTTRLLGHQPKSSRTRHGQQL